MKRLLALLLLIPNLAFAQTAPVTQQQVLNAINSNLPTNNANEISALLLRNTLDTMTSAIFQNAFPPCTNGTNLGFSNDGITDNLVIWNAWVVTIGTSSACLELQPGIYKFNGPATATLAATQTIQINGSGQDVTEVWFANGNGFTFTMNAGTPIGFINSSSIGVNSLAITTSIAGSNNGLTINGNTINGYIPRQTNIRNITFRGHTITAWWGVNIFLSDLSDVFIDTVGIYGLNNTNTNGIGISYFGSSNGTTPTLLNITNLTEFFLNIGISTTGFWQGLNVSQANIVDVTTGISCIASVTIQPECNVFNSQINAARHSIVYNNIQTSIISNNLFYQGAYSGLVNGDAIISQSTGSSNVISSNVFSGFTLGGATPNCIDISGAGSPVNTSTITANTFSGCTVNVVAGNSFNTMVSSNINATGIPFTGGGTFFAYMGTTILAFPGASMTIGGSIATPVIGINAFAANTALTAQGSDSTSGTFSAIFQNSVGSQIASFRDDGSITLFPNTNVIGTNTTGITADGYDFNVQNSSTTARSIFSGVNAGTTSDANRCGVVIPTGTTVTGVNCFAAYVLNQVAASGINQNGVGYFAQVISAVNSAATWGLNPACNDTTNNASTATTSRKCIGLEFDCTLATNNSGSSCQGSTMIIAGLFGEQSGGNAYQAGASFPASPANAEALAHWTNTFVSPDGVTLGQGANQGAALIIGSIVRHTAGTASSQSILFNRWNSGTEVQDRLVDGGTGLLTWGGLAYFGGQYIANAAAVTTGAGQISYGGTTVAAGASNCPTGTVGGSAVAGCVVINVAGTQRVVPFF